MFFRTQGAKRLFRLAPARETRRHTWPPGQAGKGGPAAQPADGSFRIVTYNIHKCRGLDGRVQPQRIVEVLREVEADIIALQEVAHMGHGRRTDNQAAFIADELGLHYCFGENRKFRGGRYGNVILSRLPVISEQNYDLSRPGREERGCLRTDVILNGAILHIYNVHLGVAYLERRHQGRRLVGSDILARGDLQGPRILLGDFNEWLRGLTTRLLAEHFGSADIRVHLGRKHTYPGPLPLLHLDNIYFDDGLRLEGAMLHRSRKALIASDHLPLAADFRVRAITGVQHPLHQQS